MKMRTILCGGGCIVTLLVEGREGWREGGWEGGRKEEREEGRKEGRKEEREEGRKEGKGREAEGIGGERKEGILLCLWYFMILHIFEW